MTLRKRRIIVTAAVAAIIMLANFLVLAGWLEQVGVIRWAQGMQPLRANQARGTCSGSVMVAVQAA